MITTTFDRTRLAGKATAENVIGKVNEWRGCPGNEEAAVLAASAYAMHRNSDFVVVPGNSYGHKVYHIFADINEAISATAMAGRFAGYLALPNGEIWNGTIVIERK